MIDFLRANPHILLVAALICGTFVIWSTAAVAGRYDRRMEEEERALPAGEEKEE